MPWQDVLLSQDLSALSLPSFLNQGPFPMRHRSLEARGQVRETDCIQETMLTGRLYHLQCTLSRRLI